MEVTTTTGEVIKLEGEYEHYSGGGETVTRRIKEQDKVTAPKFPSITQTRNWHNTVGRNLMLASGRADGAEVLWWNKVMEDGAKFEDFADSGGARFAILDLKLHQCLTAVIKEGCRTLAAKLATMEDKAMMNGEILKGRQLGWLIHDWFRLNPNMKPLYGFQDINDIQWMGDDKIFEFLQLWRGIVSQNTIQLTHEQLAVILLAKIPDNSKAIGQDKAYYKRLPDGHEQKTYDYLINSMERYLDHVQMEHNQGLRRAAMQKGRAVGAGGLVTGSSGGPGAGTGVQKKPCYFFNHGSCKNKDENCRFGHVHLPAAEKAKMEKPTTGSARTPSPRRGGGAGASADGSGQQQQPQQQQQQQPSIRHCFSFLKGNCKKGDDCMFSHLGQEAVDEIKRARAKAEAKAKAKAAPKPKAKATAAKPLPVAWDARVVACIANE